MAVTGLGVVSPAGGNIADFFGNIMAGRSGIRRLTADFSDKLSVKIAAQADFNPADYFSKKQTGVYDKTSLLSMAAASEAWADSGLSLNEEEKTRAGVYMGTGLGGAHTLDDVYVNLLKKDAARVSPLSVVKIMCNAPSSHISIQYGLAGPCLTFSTACSSSSVAIGEAFRQIRDGYSDVMVAGGTESIITYGSFKCWESLGILALEDTEDAGASCKPFSKDRTGLVIGEGAGIVVLEEMERAIKRGAKIYGELAGYGSTGDASHITNPSVEGQSRAIRLALEDSGAGPDDIGYINAHGTATITNDIVETQAIKKIFGERAYKVPVSSTKSMHGHLMGAAGAVEFVITVLSVRNNAIPPTANLKVPDPECDLDYVSGGGRDGVAVRAAMSNSFAFGGTNAVLIVKKV